MAHHVDPATGRKGRYRGVTGSHLKAIADWARLGGHVIRFEEWIGWRRRKLTGRLVTEVCPIETWSDRRLLRRVAVRTHIGGKEPAPWTREEERERLIWEELAAQPILDVS
jgi:hypothetical protein